MLVPPLARGPVRRLLEKALPRVGVVSPGEIVPGTAIEKAGEVLAGDRPKPQQLKSGRG